MKKTYTILPALLLTTILWAQSPEKMSYQAVIRNSSDQLLTNQQVGMQISILQNETPVYVETQTPTTNANGLVTVEIGTGTTTGDFSAINWANGTYFIKTEIDPTGESSYTITGTSQLLSVPYALYSKTSGNGITTAQAEEITTNTAKIGLTTEQSIILSNTSGTNSGNQDISGIATNSTAIALNTAKTGITTAQAEEITTNTAKVGLTSEQSIILSNTSGTNSGNQNISGIATNSTAIALNTAKTGITTAQAEEITTNTAKVGLTSEQTTILSNTSGNNSGDQTISRTGTTVTLTNGGTFTDSVNTYTAGNGVEISDNIVSTTNGVSSFAQASTTLYTNSTSTFTILPDLSTTITLTESSDVLICYNIIYYPRGGLIQNKVYIDDVSIPISHTISSSSSWVYNGTSFIVTLPAGAHSIDLYYSSNNSTVETVGTRSLQVKELK